ncbi:MAG TPA: DUF4185 domain-containing protein [Smithella sp.]|nr:DUF4185 domain-containing protein [Smithella sp.]
MILALVLILSTNISFAGDVRNPSSEVPALSHIKNSPPQIEIINYSMVCKLINERFNDDPTANDLQHRFNLKGTDLGISAASREQVWFFFGDTMAFKDSWKPGSGPDSVGYVDASAEKLAANPELLCGHLNFLRAKPPAEHDFAAGRMIPPTGQALSMYVRNPAGPKFPDVPGTFEVPSGAFSYGGNMYIFYTGGPDLSVKPVNMTISYLAKWESPSPDKQPHYQILYMIDEQDGGRMGGHFINVAPVVNEDDGYLYLFGSGSYRRSAVYLARKPLKSLSQPGGFEYFSGLGKWLPEGTMAVPVAEENAVGELSARHYKRAGVWLLMYAAKGQVVLRAARRPDGPWSQAVVVHSMRDENFRVRYCCGEGPCDGKHMIHCDKAGAYAPYLLPVISPPEKNGNIRVNYLLSTWNPYNTVLMSADIRISGNTQAGP